MKICIISNLYEPHHVGGAEAVAKIQVEELVKQGHELVVITTKPTGRLNCENKNYKIYRFKPLNLFYYKNLSRHNSLIKIVWHILDMFNLHSYFAVKKILKYDKPDVVITHNLKGIGYLIPKAIKSLEIKHVHNLHDVQLSNPSGLLIKDEENSVIAAGLLTKIYENLCKKLFSSADIVISPSKWLLNFYTDKQFFTKSKSLVVPNPVEEVAELKVKTTKTNNYLYIGQIEKFKGINWLIDFWQKNNIKDNLFIVGDGGQLEKIKDQSYSHIKVLGRVEKQELFDLFDKSDFLIMPSFCYESFGKVIIDSYSHSVPVIVRQGGGVDEIVENQKTGFLYKSDEEFQLLLDKCKILSIENYNFLQKNSFNKSKQFVTSEYIKQLQELLSL